MKKVILSLIVNGISLYVADQVVENMDIQTAAALIIASVVFGLVNITIKPVIKLLAFPISLLTLGLFGLVINGILLKLTAFLTPSFEIRGWIPAIGAAIIIAITNSFLSFLVKEKKNK